MCPACGQNLSLSVAVAKDNEILEGSLTCVGCQRSFTISRGIPRFAKLEEVHSDKQDTAKGFGWQWTHFVQEDKRYAEQFLGWIKPVKPEFFANKVVLEGGCGKGRHTQLAATWGARDVIGIDLSIAVETAYDATLPLPNATLCRQTSIVFHLRDASITGSLLVCCIISQIPKADLNPWPRRLSAEGTYLHGFTVQRTTNGSPAW